jgi:hypothetical protein
MRKTGVVVLLLLFLLVPLTSAAEGDNCTLAADCSSGEICQDDICVLEEEAEDTNGADLAFECLEEKAGDCTGLTTQELALTILATPENIFDDCVEELQDRKSSNNWGNVRDTSLAILALEHAGEDTEASEEWLLSQSRTPTRLIWYLQQDSDGATECHIGYQTNDYTVNIGENKKIDSNAGSCLTRAQSNFWLQVSTTCYNEEISIQCDKDFIATLLYKNADSNVIYPLEGTDSAPALGTIDLKVNSKCFGTTSCEYEATAWATLALLETGHSIEEYIPYVIAMGGSNGQYLPNAFSYMTTNYDDYATKLIASQKIGNYWEAASSAYNRYYDTSLALVATGSSSSEQIAKAKEWMFFSQGSNGCWQNSIRDTAIALWALEGRSGRSSNGGGSVTYCTQADYFCIPSAECTGAQDVGDSYFCPSLSNTCCTTENLQECSAYGGSECTSEEICVGNERKATDTIECCTGTCEERPQTTECESNYFYCKESCSSSQEEASYSCSGSGICCKPSEPKEKGSTWWIWLLIILTLLVLGAIGYIYRDKLKLLWFQMISKFKKDKGGKKGASSGGPRPGIPPRPGFPPVRRMTQRPSPRPGQRPTSGKRSYDRRDKAMSETFSKLRNMSK